MRGVEAICAFLADRSLIVSSLTTAPQVVAFVIDCIWTVILGSKIGLDFFVAHEGVDLLLQLLDVCPYFLVKQLMSCLVDILVASEDARSHFHEWRSSVPLGSTVSVLDHQRTALSILLRLFFDETHRLAGNASQSVAPRRPPPVSVKQNRIEKTCDCTQGHSMTRYMNKVPPSAASDGWYNCQVCGSRFCYLNIPEKLSEKLHIDGIGGGWNCSYCQVDQCLSCVAFALAYKSTDSKLADLLGSQSATYGSSSVQPLPIPVPPGYSSAHGVTELCVSGLSQQDIRSAIFSLVLSAESPDSSVWSYCSEEQKVQLTSLKQWLDTKKFETYSKIRSEFLAEQAGIEGLDGLLDSVGWWDSSAFQRPANTSAVVSPITTEDEQFLQVIIQAQLNQKQEHEKLANSTKQELSQSEQKELAQFLTTTSHHIAAAKSIELSISTPHKSSAGHKYEAGANLHVRKRVSVQQAAKLASSYSTGGCFIYHSF